jgi:hypothetical protein
MNAHQQDKDTRSPSRSSSDDVHDDSERGGVRIPRTKDGFFGYSDEKSLQHVRLFEIISLLNGQNERPTERLQRKLGHLGEVLLHLKEPP